MDRPSSTTTESGVLVAANLTDDLKSKVWRGTTLSETITVTWDSPQAINMVALPFCNFSSNAKMQVKLYTGAGDVIPVLDTGEVFCCGYKQFGDIDWGYVPLAENAYNYGGNDIPSGIAAYYYGNGAYAVSYFAIQSVKKIEIILDDYANGVDTYLEASRLVTGRYWSPAVNAEYGASIESVDKSKQYRNESGDLKSDRGISFKKMTFKLGNLDNDDMILMLKRIKANGKYKPFYISVFPESADVEEEQTYQVYGKLPTLKSVARTRLGRSQSGITIEEI